MQPLQKKQAIIDRAIWDVIFDLVPEGATRVRLLLQQSSTASHEIVHTLEASREDRWIPVDPTGLLFERTRDLMLMLQEHDIRVLEAVYEAWELPDGRWKTTQRYSYDN